MTNKFSKIGKQASKSENLTVDQSFERELPKAGIAFLRFVGYVEFGRHAPQAGSTHKPALKAMLTFELNHPKHMIEIDGKKVPQTYQLRLNKGKTAKSGYRKVFKLMNMATGGKATSFFEMLGAPLMGEIYHNTVGEGDKKKTYANLDLDGAFSFKKPEKRDELTEELTPIAIPEVHGELQGFMWENEDIDDETYVELWNDLFIDGTREVDDPDNKGKKIEKSKNWIQEFIQTNLEWDKSRLAELTTEHVELDDLATEVDLAGAAETDEPLTV